MEKKKPHYNLQCIQADVQRLGAVAFTKSSLDGGRTMGLTLRQMQRVIASLERRALYKSMSTHADHKVWQDVYHVRVYGLLIYIKVTYHPSGGPPVIAFKEKHR
ncbi:MAG: type II toxin-antitoxin system MqsR family toxin [Pseudomonadota bacterium]